MLFLIRPLLERFSGRLTYGFAQRLGRYPDEVRAAEDVQTVWLHASSVGEVQAAIVLVHALLPFLGPRRIVVTSMTEQGHRLADSRMPDKVLCLMAPLDLPQAVSNALRSIRPCCYICLETELWPVMLTRVRQTGIPMLLLNGRLSQRSFHRYQYIRHYVTALLQGFSRVAVISETDGQRYHDLGVPTSRLQVCGNLKYDMPAESPDRTRAESRLRLQIADERVFLCGSTHNDEEEQLFPVFQALATRGPAVLVLAPRHLERLPAVEALLRRWKEPFDRFSALGEFQRNSRVVLLDTMGDLADLYAGADFVFCGGSLVDRGGHNIIEAARWGRAVYFGPYMKDFRDAASLLVESGGGFQVADAAELTRRILRHIDAPEEYAHACSCAAEAAAQQRGAVARQTALVREVLQTA
ncbi:MAG: 3-deoxy-D-manno-octulosonic acid transferase [Desulfobulbus sp.]|nr:3-deoxy-D-manno-octulosonic acid transferase [Desulfobulbus sp.]